MKLNQVVEFVGILCRAPELATPAPTGLHGEEMAARPPTSQVRPRNPSLSAPSTQGWHSVQNGRGERARAVGERGPGQLHPPGALNVSPGTSCHPCHDGTSLVAAWTWPAHCVSQSAPCEKEVWRAWGHCNTQAGPMRSETQQCNGMRSPLSREFYCTQLVMCQDSRFKNLVYHARPKTKGVVQRADVLL